MDWLIFALLSPAFWGMNNVINKFLMVKKFNGYYSLVSYLNILDLFFAVIIYFTMSISVNFPYNVFSMAVGLLPVLAFWFYTKALMVEEISRITPLFQFIPIFVVFLSAIFLNEILNVQKYFGIILIVLTSILISYKKTESGKSLSSAFRLLIPFSFILSIYTIMLKILLNYLTYWSIFFWMIIGSFLGALGLLSFSKPRREFVKNLPNLGFRTFIVTFVGECAYLLGVIFSLLAMSLGYVSLVSALSGLQHLFVFTYMLVLSIFMPKILKEEINKQILFVKIFAIALMFIGTWLVTM
jgi:uncharacterized membrane protein